MLILKKEMGSKKGFTIAEFMVASLVIMLLMGIVWSLYIFIQQQWQEGYITMKLERSASTAMESMVRGITGRHGIREANAISPPDPGDSSTSIDFTGLDDVTRRFYFSSADNTLYYRNNVSGGSDEVISTDVQSATFSRASNLITVNLVLEETAGQKSIEVELETNVKFRN